MATPAVNQPKIKPSNRIKDFLRKSQTLKTAYVNIKPAFTYMPRVINLIRRDIEFRKHLKESIQRSEGMPKTILTNLLTEGYYHVEGFWTEDKVNEWVQRLDSYYNDPARIESAYRNRKGGIRWSHVEKDFPQLADEYMHHPLIWEIAQKFYGKGEIARQIMYQHTWFDDSVTEEQRKNKQYLGLGREGYHMDSTLNSLKTMLLMTDVKIENGPFVYCPRTHHFQDNPIKTLKIKKLLKAIYSIEEHKPFSLYLNDAEVKRYKIDEQSKPLLGKKGDLLIAATFGFHKASLLAEGDRKILWNYYG